MICRLCLINISVENKVSLFNSMENNGELEVVKMIAKYFHLEITQYDAISTTICQECCNHLDEFHSFYVYVEQQQSTLQNEFLEVKCDVELSSHEMKVLSEHSEESMLDIKDVLADYADQPREPIEMVQLKCEPEADVFTEKETWASNEDAVSESTDDNVPLKSLRTKSNDGSTPTTRPKKSTKSKIMLLANKSKAVVKNPKITLKVCGEENSSKTKCKSESKSLRKSTLKSKKSPELKLCNEELSSSISKKQNKKLKPSPKESADMDEFISKHMQLKCELCDVPFQKFSDMNPHFKDNHGIRSYVMCCGTRCVTRKDLFAHIHWHLNPEHFKCVECGKLLKSRYSLAVHKINKHHKTEDLIYNCEICDKKFARKCFLNQHLLYHQAEKKFTCEHCNKSFVSKHRLEKHIKSMHDNIFPHICDVCGKKFKFKPSFDIHVLEHQGIMQPQMQCSVCGEWKKNKNRLRLHMATHNNVDVKCKHCGRVCPTQTALRGHVQYMHRAPLKFHCKYCDKSFKTEQNLKEHVATHTGENLYNCPHCAREFRSRANMYVHIKRQHPQEWLAAQLLKPNGPPNMESS